MIVAAAVVVLTASSAWAHGTRGIIESCQGIRALAAYDDGEPMAFAEVEVTEADTGTVTQTGRTDRNGVFVFAPDRSGKWRVVINDGMGHRLVLGRQIDMAENGVPEASADEPPPVAGVSRGQSVVSGLSIIFGLCGLFYGWKARRHPPLPLVGKDP